MRGPPGPPSGLPCRERVSNGTVAQVALAYLVADYGDGFYGTGERGTFAIEAVSRAYLRSNPGGEREATLKATPLGSSRPATAFDHACSWLDACTAPGLPQTVAAVVDVMSGQTT